MADQKKQNQEGLERSDVTTKDVGPPNPESFRGLADDVVPERDDDQRAYKKQLKADSGQAEVRAKVERVEGTVAAETPSGHALAETAGISDDTKRGEEYTRLKTARRHGYEG